MTRVKVCGITSREDLRVAVDAGADAVGLLVDVPVDSPREIDARLAADLAAATPPFVTTVLVTMPRSPDHATDLVSTVEPDAIQVHGEMAVGDLAYLQSNVDAHVLKTVGGDDPARARRYDDIADALLVDSVDDDGAGGTGRTHDWERTRAVAADLDSPVVLAGGLTPDNVGEAVETVDPFAVDVASGVESVGGEKDPEAVVSFVENATHPPETPTP